MTRDLPPVPLTSAADLSGIDPVSRRHLLRVAAAAGAAGLATPLLGGTAAAQTASNSTPATPVPRAVDVVQRYYAAYARFDFDALRQVIAPDAVLRIPGRHSLSGDLQRRLPAQAPVAALGLKAAATHSERYSMVSISAVRESSRLIRVASAGVVLAALTACGSATSGSPTDSGPGASSAASGPATSPPEPGRQPSAEQLQVPRTLVDALNRGDSAAARAAFAPTARFDSVGRIYPDREAIFARFIDPEVIGAGGRYVERSARVDGDRVVVEYDFTTRSGGRERFTYAYLVSDGLITDVVGRYV